MKMKGLLVVLIMLGVILYFFLYRSPLSKVDTYRIYYGPMDEAVLDKMKAYDMVIVEALHFDPEMVKRLQEANVKVIGYISVAEIGSWDAEILGEIQSSDYLYQAGAQVINGSNPLGDLTKARYRDLLLHIVDKRIMALGMDGVFFDTLDSINLLEAGQARINQALGYYDLVSEIRKKWPDTLLIQNRGFEYVELMDRGMIDAVLWENFSGERVGESSYLKRIKMLKTVYFTKNIRTMILAYKDEGVSREASLKRGWLFSFLDGQEALTDWK